MRAIVVYIYTNTTATLCAMYVNPISVDLTLSKEKLNQLAKLAGMENLWVHLKVTHKSRDFWMKVSRFVANSIFLEVIWECDTFVWNFTWIWYDLHLKWMYRTKGNISLILVTVENIRY